MYKNAIEEVCKKNYKIEADYINPVDGNSALGFLINKLDIDLFKKFYKSDKHK